MLLFLLTLLEPRRGTTLCHRVLEEISLLPRHPRAEGTMIRSYGLGIFFVSCGIAGSNPSPQTLGQRKRSRFINAGLPNGGSLQGERPSSLHSGRSMSWAESGFMRSSKWIDDQGFLHRTFEVVDGCEEETGHCPPRSTKFHKIMRVRQVPGDGSCLFHSITASLSLAVNGTHHPMELLPLRWHSNYVSGTATQKSSSNYSMLRH